MKKIKVLIIDDSALMRKLLDNILSSDPNIEVIGSAEDPIVARTKIKQLNPDVLTLDIEMPKMDGITFLSNLMRLRPMPVVMISTLTQRGAEATMRALELGAIDFVSKPKVDLNNSLENCANEIISKVKSASKAKVTAITKAPASCDIIAKPKSSSVTGKPSSTIIAIGASTGGTEAIKEVLLRLKPDCPGVVIAQHIPPVFSLSFAERMNQQTSLTVYEAKDGQEILHGHVYIAPGDRHLKIVRHGGKYSCVLDDGPAVNRHKPSVDVLFNSVAQYADSTTHAAILTGMGKDGAKGLRALRDKGAKTIAQDEATSVVWGMPGAAVNEENAADHVLPLLQIAAALTR